MIRRRLNDAEMRGDVGAAWAREDDVAGTFSPTIDN